MRSCFCFSALSALSLLAACPPVEDPPIDEEGLEGEGEPAEGEGEEGEGEGEEGEGEEGEGEGEGEDPCEVPETITGARTIPVSCSPLTIDRTTTIATDATLTIEPGVTIRFDGDITLINSGTLIAAGEADAGIVLESAAAAPAAGDWRGVASRGAQVLVMEHVTVRHGGRDDPDFADGCVTLQQLAPNGVTITDTAFEDCAVACLVSANPNTGVVDNNSYTRCPIAMEVHGSMIGSITSNQTFVDAPVIKSRNGLGAGIAESQTWEPQDLPWTFTQTFITVNGGATLTLQPGLTLRFTGISGIVVGGNPKGGGGALVATGVTFTDDGLDNGWEGIDFEENTLPSTLTDCTLENADVAVELNNTGTDVTVTGSTFTNNAQDVFVDCFSEPTLTDNGAINVVEEPGCP